MLDDIGGVWRTVGGRRIFIKDGEDLKTAMKNSGKFNRKKEKTYYIDKNTGKYIGRNIGGEYFGLTDNKKRAELTLRDIEAIEKSTKFFKKHNIEPQEKKEIKEELEKVSYAEKKSIENDLFARSVGYSSYAEYTKQKDIQIKENIKKTKEEYEKSYVYNNAKKGYDKYNKFFNDEERISVENEIYNKEVFSELIKREAKKMYDIEETHSSAKKGSKFSDSIYLKNKETGTEVRISNHELPETAERLYNREKTGGRTRWDKELVLNNDTMKEIVQIKTEKEFKNFIRELFE